MVDSVSPLRRKPTDVPYVYSVYTNSWGLFPFFISLSPSLVLSFSLCGSCFAHFLLHTLSRVYTSTGVRRLAYEKSQRRFVDDCKAWMNMISRLYNHLVNGGSAAFAWQTFWSKSTTNSRSLSFRLFSFGFFFFFIYIYIIYFLKKAIAGCICFFLSFFRSFFACLCTRRLPENAGDPSARWLHMAVYCVVCTISASAAI